jgi:hypothetical protein
MGVLASRKSPQTSTASSAASARGCIDMGIVVGEAAVRAKRDVKRRVRRWVVCIFGRSGLVWFGLVSCFCRNDLSS